MARWTLYLSEFDIKLVHIPGRKNIQADSLLRKPDLCPQGMDNEDVVVLTKHLFVNLIDMELQKKIANATNMDYDAAEAIKKLLKQGPKEAKKDLMDWEVEEFEGENVLFYKGKNYVTTSNYVLYRACTRVRYWARYNSQQLSSKISTSPKISLFDERLKECHCKVVLS
jgi:hypothetical protein